MRHSVASVDMTLKVKVKVTYILSGRRSVHSYYLLVYQS